MFVFCHDTKTTTRRLHNHRRHSCYLPGSKASHMANRSHEFKFYPRWQIIFSSQQQMSNSQTEEVSGLELITYIFQRSPSIKCPTGHTETRLSVGHWKSPSSFVTGTSSTKQSRQDYKIFIQLVGAIQLLSQISQLHTTSRALLGK